MTRRCTFVAIILLAVAVPAVLNKVNAQQAAPAGDLNAAILAEIRGLRTAMEQLASTGPRVQLAMGRLQLQEQRMNSLVRRLDSLREQIASKEGERLEAQQRLARFEIAVGAERDAEQRRDMEGQVSMGKTAIARLAAEIQRLRADEADTSTALAQEQGRWNEINARLEELDRALGKANR